MPAAKKTARPLSSPLSLALQGGGTHAAFAWGALDALLEKNITIHAISAVSGGSMNAVILAEGWRRNGAEGAREHLQTFWRKLSIAAQLLPFRPGTFDRFLSEVGIDFSPSTVALDYLTRLFSPYQFNLFDINPVRGIVEEMVDFPALCKKAPFALYIGATHAGSGEGRIFTEADLSLDAVMASACLPYLFKTVMVDDEPYWDGGYSGNPPLFPLYDGERASNDILLLRTLPAVGGEVPTQAADILDHATEISFNASLAHERRALEAYNRAHPQQSVALHIIESDEMIGTLGRASKLNADWNFLLYLKDLGAQAAQDWLDAN